MLREPGREWLSQVGTVAQCPLAQCARQESQSVAAGMAAKSCGASPGGISGDVFGVLAGCRKGTHPLLQETSPTP